MGQALICFQILLNTGPKCFFKPQEGTDFGRSGCPKPHPLPGPGTWGWPRGTSAHAARVGIQWPELRYPLQEARQLRRPADGPTEASPCASRCSSSFAYRRARRCDRRERGRGPGPWRARALTARPCSLTCSFPASEHSMAVKVTPTLCCCFYCIRDVPRALSAAPRLFPLLSLPGS